MVFRAGRFDDAPDAAMRDRAAEKGNLALPRKEHIRDEVATTVQMAGVLLALDPGSDPLPEPKKGPFGGAFDGFAFGENK